MSLDNADKRELIAAKRTPLEREKYAAELDVGVAEKSGDEALLIEPQDRLRTIEEQLEVLDQKEAELPEEESPEEPQEPGE